MPANKMVNVGLKKAPAVILPNSITYMNTAVGKKGFWPKFEVDPKDLVYLDKTSSKKK
jgi:hypothetical protein